MLCSLSYVYNANRLVNCYLVFNIPELLILQVAAGGTHSVVLTREGHVWTWGQPWPPGDMYAVTVH